MIPNQNRNGHSTSWFGIRDAKECKSYPGDKLANWLATTENKNHSLITLVPTTMILYLAVSRHIKSARQVSLTISSGTRGLFTSPSFVSPVPKASRNTAFHSSKYGQIVKHNGAKRHSVNEYCTTVLLWVSFETNFQPQQATSLPNARQKL